ncbi:glycerophosphodiester phosphodiesterase family protein [Daejeonella sp.]|uniref:glycerophosphodiester phosphodiesterase family protein n=1 Tax=Daejeonella sp. TaxID=2805397 RepID=UPI0030C2DBB5
MKTVLKLIVCGLVLISPVSLSSQTKTLNILKIKNSKQLIDYFRYTGNDLPIISGHRGGTTKGYPENCIPTLENTLKYTPAFFEIDPRLTKDGCVVLMHDATLERTTNGTGKVSDYTYAELQKFRLKDPEGNVTPYPIPLLTDVIKWSKGKAVLNLDHKDVPLEMTEKIINEVGNEVIMLTIHSPEQAKFYLKNNPEAMFSAHILTRKAFDNYEKAGIPWTNMIAYIGPKNKPENKELLDLLHSRGVMCMISAAPSYEKLTEANERAVNYRDTFRQGADILESDLPVEVGMAIKTLSTKKSPKQKYHAVLKTK